MRRLQQCFDERAAAISKQRSGHGYRRIPQPFQYDRCHNSVKQALDRYTLDILLHASYKKKYVEDATPR
jgi:hypothetical protein